MSSSCSTTITGYLYRVMTKVLLSTARIFGCKPILGSSNIYMEPTKLLPSDVAKLIRWDSHQKGSRSFCLKSDNLNPLRSKGQSIVNFNSRRWAICFSYIISNSAQKTLPNVWLASLLNQRRFLNSRRRLQCVDAFLTRIAFGFTAVRESITILYFIIFSSNSLKSHSGLWITCYLSIVTLSDAHSVDKMVCVENQICKHCLPIRL
jgi:hypothetical protein